MKSTLKTRLKKLMNPWLFNSKIFEDDHIHPDAVGFIYEMEAIIDGKSVKYIGKKNFYSHRKKPLGKKALAALKDKRAKKYTLVSKLNYKNYYRSNDVLKEANKKGIPIKRYIVRICFSKAELTYFETKYQFIQGVLEKEEYLNRNILGKFYKNEYGKR